MTQTSNTFKIEKCKCGHGRHSHTYWSFDGSSHSLNCKECDCKKFVFDELNEEVLK